MPRAHAARGGPLYVGRTLLYPNLGEPIRNPPAGQLPFYFALYGDSRGATAARICFATASSSPTAPVQLPPRHRPPASSTSGRLPIGALPAGTYELRIR